MGPFWIIHLSILALKRFIIMTAMYIFFETPCLSICIVTPHC